MIAQLEIADQSTSSEKFPASRTPLRLGLYLAINLGFIAAINIIDLSISRIGHDPLAFLMLLFALCSSPLLFINATNGRHCILVISMPILFIFYGMNDILTYFVHYPGYWYESSGSLLTEAEGVILGGLLAFLLGFVLISNLLKNKSSRWLVSDWNDRPAIVVGLLGMVVALWAIWKIQLAADPRVHTVNMDPIMGGILVAGRMMEAVSAVLLSYIYLKTRSQILLWLLLAIAALKIPMGLVLDSKEIAISFIVVFCATKWLYDGKLPIRWLGLISIMIMLTFPIFYAYRATVFGGKQFSRSQAIDNISSTVTTAINESAKGEGGATQKGIQAFATRVDLKSVISLTVARTGKDVPFQDGYTLSPIFYVFIPRILMPDKPTIPVGRLFNQAFHISESPNTYISTSFLGELYWNYGWSGVLIGMLAIGASLGTVSALFHVNETKTVSRMLILMSAIYLLSLRFETGVAQQYTLFLRSVVIILFLHVLFRKRSIGVMMH